MSTLLINILLVFRTSVVWFRNQVHIWPGVFTIPFSVLTCLSSLCMNHLEETSIVTKPTKLSLCNPVSMSLDQTLLRIPCSAYFGRSFVKAFRSQFFFCNTNPHEYHSYDHASKLTMSISLD